MAPAAERIKRLTCPETAGSLQQRDIEDYFKAHGLYYDRRKNFYKNEGRPVASIISIPYLAQAIVAILLQQPDNSRARPSTLLKTDEAYSRVFDARRPVEFYLACAKLMQKCESAIRIDVAPDMRNNLRFQFAMLAAIALTRNTAPTVQQIIEASRVDISEELTSLTAGFILWAYEKIQDENLATFDRIAKSATSTAFIKQNLDDYLKVVLGQEKPWFDEL